MSKEHWLVSYSRKVNASLPGNTDITGLSPEVNRLVNDIENYPHAFVLACCMDRQVSSDRAWSIPYKVMRSLCHEFTMEELSQISLEEYEQLFSEQTLHRYNEKMAAVFHSAVMRIQDQYDGDASRIWAGCPSSAAVVYRFLEFDGVGVKIATMATNILHREHKVPLSDLSSIDISPDVHVRRIFQRAGLVCAGASNDAVIYKARELCTEYPGILDSACWNIGTKFCHPASPDCASCPVCTDCPKLLDAAKKKGAEVLQC
jgi:endonuclease III